MRMEVDIDRVIKALSGDDDFECPMCGHPHLVNDSDVTVQVVSYWGEEPHRFSCFDCGHDFLVKETVTRRFEVLP